MAGNIELLNFLNQQTDKKNSITDIKEIASHSLANDIQNKLLGTANIHQTVVSNDDDKNGPY